jgi:hypothetical protein
MYYNNLVVYNMKKIIFFITIFIYFSSCVSGQENVIISGQKLRQESNFILLYEMPSGWLDDEEAEEQLCLHDLLVPEGYTMKNTDRLISVAFQKKDPDVSYLTDLESFFRNDMAVLLTLFPDLKAERWQPDKLNPYEINFLSLEVYSEDNISPSPTRYLYIESVDGFFTVTLIVKKRENLDLGIFNEFFNSIVLEKK